MSHSRKDAGPPQPRQPSEHDRPPALDTALAARREQHHAAQTTMNVPDALKASEYRRTSAESERDEWRTRALLGEAKVRRLQERELLGLANPTALQASPTRTDRGRP